MRRRKHKLPQEEAELDVTSFMNLMVVLIPFLLATAVFSQVSIQELNMPEPGVGGAKPEKEPVTIEVMVRKNAIEVGNGRVITHRFPKKEDAYDLDSLTARLLGLKKKYPDKEDATVLLEPDIEYNDMIAVMDTVKFYKVENPEAGIEVAAVDANAAAGESAAMANQSVVLFPDISIGDAP